MDQHLVPTLRHSRRARVHADAGQDGHRGRQLRERITVDRNFDVLTRSVSGVPSRRHVLRGLAGAGFVVGRVRLSDRAEAKQRKRKPKRRTGLCQKDGSPCHTPGKRCKQRYCLHAPFTIEANWPEQAGHAIVLFVPPEHATTGPAPYIHDGCKPDEYDCEGTYPFACVDGDDQTAGPKVTTINRRLPGSYEYWIELGATTVAGEATVSLKDSTGRVVRQWANPAGQISWHVFDVDGRDGRVTAIDALIDEALPVGAHDPSTHVCPV